MDQLALIDAGPLISFYNKRDKYHKQIIEFFRDTSITQLVTTDACIAEVMYSLGQIKGQSHQLQAQFARHINKEIWHREPLIQEDFLRIADLFQRYNNVPADFADLSLVVISERLDIYQIVTLDSDFDIYRRFDQSTHSFVRIFYPNSEV